MDLQRRGDAAEARDAQRAAPALDAADLTLRQADAAAKLRLGDAPALADVPDPHVA